MSDDKKPARRTLSQEQQEALWEALDRRPTREEREALLREHVGPEAAVPRRFRPKREEREKT